MKIVNQSSADIESASLEKISDGILKLIVNAKEKWLPYQVEQTDEREAFRVYAGNQEMYTDNSYLEVQLPILRKPSFYVNYSSQCKDQIYVIFITDSLSMKAVTIDEVTL